MSQRRSRQVLALSFGAILFVILLLITAEDGFRALSSASPSGLVVAFVATASMTLVTALRWWLLIGTLSGGRRPPLGLCYRSLMVGRVLGLVLPQIAADLGVRPVLLRAEGKSSGLSAVGGATLEKVTDGTLLVVLALPAAGYLFFGLTASRFVQATIAVGLAWMACLFVCERFVYRGIATALQVVSRPADRWPVTKRFAARLAEMSTALRTLPVPRHLAAVSGLSLLRYGLICVVFYSIAASLHLDGITFVEIMASVPAAQIGMLVAFTPGAIGFVEGGFWGALAIQQISEVEVNAFLLGQRLLSSAFFILLALVSLLLSALFRARGPATNEPD